MNKIIPKITIEQVFDLEIRNAVWLTRILPISLVTTILTWKVRRKYRRYLISKEGELLYRKQKENNDQ